MFVQVCDHDSPWLPVSRQVSAGLVPCVSIFHQFHHHLVVTMLLALALHQSSEVPLALCDTCCVQQTKSMQIPVRKLPCPDDTQLIAWLVFHNCRISTTCCRSVESTADLCKMAQKCHHMVSSHILRRFCFRVVLKEPP